MKESLLEKVAPYTSLHFYIGRPFVKGLLLCLRHTRRRAKYYPVIYRYRCVWVELYRMAKKAI